MRPESVVSAYYAMKKARCTSSRAAMTRASDLGHPCTAYIAFTRIAGEKAEPPDAKLACIFAEGNTQEQAVKTDLEKLGFTITQSQRAIYWDKYEISGHIDGFIFDSEKNSAILIEIKSCSPFAFAKFNTADDVKNAKQYFYRKWIAQLNVYMLLESLEVSWLILKNKASGEIKILEIKLDLGFAETLIKKAENVASGVKLSIAGRMENWLPGNRLNDPEICFECPFKSICLPEIDAGAGIFLYDDAEFAEKISRHEEIKPLAKEYDALHEEITDNAKVMFQQGQQQILCGDWQIIGKHQKRTVYDVPKEVKEKYKGYGESWITNITPVGQKPPEKKEKKQVVYDPGF